MTTTAGALPFLLVRLRTGRVHAIAVQGAQQTLCGLAYWRRYADWSFVSGRGVSCRSCRRVLRAPGSSRAWRERAAATLALREDGAA
jgi:hypothetical protein